MDAHAAVLRRTVRSRPSRVSQRRAGCATRPSVLTGVGRSSMRHRAWLRQVPVARVPIRRPERPQPRRPGAGSRDRRLVLPPASGRRSRGGCHSTSTGCRAPPPIGGFDADGCSARATYRCGIGPFAPPRCSRAPSAVHASMPDPMPPPPPRGAGRDDLRPGITHHAAPGVPPAISRPGSAASGERRPVTVSSRAAGERAAARAETIGRCPRGGHASPAGAPGRAAASPAGRPDPAGRHAPPAAGAADGDATPSASRTRGGGTSHGDAAGVCSAMPNVARPFVCPALPVGLHDNGGTYRRTGAPGARSVTAAPGVLARPFRSRREGR
jgi:hypothetical protein